jgi:hypothetical protein
VLARIVEQSGIPTITVTMLPDVAEKHHLPRIVGVEFPFGHPFGMPQDRDMQCAVAKTALSLYGRSDLPARVDVAIKWPVDFKTAYRSWQPKEPAPVVAAMKREILERRGRG